MSCTSSIGTLGVAATVCGCGHCYQVVEGTIRSLGQFRASTFPGLQIAMTRPDHHDDHDDDDYDYDDDDYDDDDDD